jgi:hypothetical protein
LTALARNLDVQVVTGGWYGSGLGFGAVRKVRPKHRRRPNATASILSSIVEVRPAAAPPESRFEIELRNGRRLRVPAAFDASALKALLAILETPT